MASRRRNGFKVGDHLMRDDESGIVHYASDMVRRWDGLWVHHSNNETRNPQEFVRARADPVALQNVRSDLPFDAPDQPITQPLFIGNTTTKTIPGPASHLFEGDGIGAMDIGGNFIVR